MDIKFISFGPNCQTAGVLKHLKYKTESYPFDWILSDINIVNDCINNNFVIFKDKTQYFLSNNGLNVGHKSYLPRMFIHRNPINNENDYSYYLRCIDRFINLKYMKCLLIFVYTLYNFDKKTNEPFMVSLQNLANTLKNNHFTNYKLILINYIYCSENETHQYNYSINDNIIILNINIYYDRLIEYALDKAIYKFYDEYNPFKEIINELLENIKNMH